MLACRELAQDWRLFASAWGTLQSTKSKPPFASCEIRSQRQSLSKEAAWVSRCMESPYIENASLHPIEAVPVNTSPQFQAARNRLDRRHESMAIFFVPVLDCISRVAQ